MERLKEMEISYKSRLEKLTGSFLCCIDYRYRTSAKTGSS
jgi:hypothetical protein